MGFVFVRVLCLLSLLVVATVGGHARADDPETDDLAALLETARVEMDLPGVRAALRLPDGTIVRAAVGFADVKAQGPLDDTIGMPGGSTGKTFVAALTLLLVEDGVLALDDPASKWLGATDWYPRLPNADVIRVRHLLAHTAGLPDYPETFRYRMASFWRALRHGSVRFEPEELIGYALDRKPAFAPGEGYRYTDVGYLVLGRLLEAATGRAYFDLLTERILTPHGLDSVRPADRSIMPDVATGYSRGAANMKRDGRMKADPTSEWTGGGLVTTPTGLVRFFAALAAGEVVAPAQFEQMLASGYRTPEDDTHYGYGVFVYDGGRAFGNAGLWPGYRSHVVHFFNPGITVAVQTNRDGRVNLDTLARRIAALAASP